MEFCPDMSITASLSTISITSTSPYRRMAVAWARKPATMLRAPAMMRVALLVAESTFVAVRRVFIPSRERVKVMPVVTPCHGCRAIGHIIHTTAQPTASTKGISTSSWVRKAQVGWVTGSHGTSDQPVAA